MENTTALNTTLPTHRVHVVEQGASARRHWVRCEIGENLKFDMGGLQSYCLANWDERVYDAFVVAAAVQFCDHTKRRPSAEWGRNFGELGSRIRRGGGGVVKCCLGGSCDFT